MRNLYPATDFMTQTAKLYTTLCRLAEQTYKMGPHSGVKRTLLVYLNEHGPSSLKKLMHDFPDPNLQLGSGQKILQEMLAEQTIDMHYSAGHTRLSLTERGREKVRWIFQLEAQLQNELQMSLRGQDIRSCTRQLEHIQRSVTQLCDGQAPAELVELASGIRTSSRP